MHTVEALLAAADVAGRPDPARAGRGSSARVVHDLAAGNAWRIPEHFDDTGRRASTTTPTSRRPVPAVRRHPGHALEWSVGLHLRAGPRRTAPPWLSATAQALFAARSPRGGRWTAPTGFVYTVGLGGPPSCASACTGSSRRARRPRPRCSLRRPGAGLRRLVRDLVAARRRLLPGPPGRLVAARALAHDGSLGAHWRGRPDAYHAWNALTSRSD